MVEYRTLKVEEWPAAVRLWVDVFGVEAPFFQSLLDCADPDDVSVGAFVDGKLVSSVHVFIRWVRDREGRPLKVGGIGSVSTHPEARRHGHSGRLLNMAVAEMEARECVWSALGTGVNDHYARHGWRTISIPYFVGVLKPDLAGDPIEAVAISPDLLQGLQPVHEAFFRDRPMSTVRSDSFWQSSGLYRTTHPEDSVFTAKDSDRVVAYLVARAFEEGIELAEGACLEGFESRLQSLAQDCLAMAVSQGRTQVRFELPEESCTFPVFQASCTQFFPMEQRSWMARPIAGRISWAELLAIHADPRGHYSDVDHF